MHGRAVQVEQKWQDRLQAAVASTEEQRQHTLAANRKIGTIEGELASARGKLAAEHTKSTDLGRQVEALRAELKQAESTQDSLMGTAAQERKRVLSLEDEVRRLTAAHDGAADQMREEKDGLQNQVRAAPASSSAPHRRLMAHDRLQFSVRAVPAAPSHRWCCMIGMSTPGFFLAGLATLTNARCWGLRSRMSPHK